ncbi:hypothetical protein EGR_00660 [Echinococcus granulosus]|uniref:Uncharacterized protein n=1 Tax=Echinococcus granulosus TaxID=6210 RepID=W6USV1_ECHGR|nr:hypothetical protein EGR_00660 [Echinococcus granulosus]EUB64710.1 hypothetical protein EGR_00660 [Echinococcus granulosus]
MVIDEVDEDEFECDDNGEDEEEEEEKRASNEDATQRRPVPLHQGVEIEEVLDENEEESSKSKKKAKYLFVSTLTIDRSRHFSSMHFRTKNRYLAKLCSFYRKLKIALEFLNYQTDISYLTDHFSFIGKFSGILEYL